MCQLVDLPYGTLMERQRYYEILLLRDSHDNTYADIAREYNVSRNYIDDCYNRIKRKQIRLYLTHLAIINGVDNTDSFKKIYSQA